MGRVDSLLSVLRKVQELFFVIFINPNCSCGVSFKTRSHACVNGEIGSEGCPLSDYVEVSPCVYVSSHNLCNWQRDGSLRLVIDRLI